MPPITPKSKNPRLGQRNTKQRQAIVSILEELDRFLSAQEIHRELEKRELGVGLTTVYRTLQALADIEAVDVLHINSGEALYRQCTTENHHHHLVCTDCGRTEEIDGGPVEAWASQVAATHGFSVLSHDAEIYGVCGNCQEIVEPNAKPSK